MTRHRIAALALVGALAFVGSVSPSAFAGMDDKDGSWVDKKVTKLTKELELTDQQQTQIRSILEAKHQAQQAKKAEWQAAHEKLTQDINAVLTPEQQGKYNAMMGDRGDKRWKDKDGHDKHDHDHKHDHGSGESH